MLDAVFMALIAAFSIGLIPILIRRGVRSSSASSATIVTLTINCVIYWSLIPLLLPLPPSALDAAILFVLSGFLGAGLGRLLNFVGIVRVGAAPSSQLVSVGLIFSAILAVAFLGEELTLLLGAGTAVVVFGIFLLERSAEESSSSEVGVRKTRWREFAIPIIAGMLWGSSIVIRKAGLNMLNSPLFGVAITSVGGLITVLTSSVIRRDLKSTLLINRKAFYPFFLAGLVQSPGFYFQFYAIGTGQVLVVSPVLASSPLFTTILSYIFLKGFEKVTLGIFISAIIIVSGLVLVTIS